MNRISKLKFDSPSLHFNSASIGIPPQPLPSAAIRLTSQQSSRGFDWDKAVLVVQEKFGKLLDQPANTISIFHNTTAGVQRTLLRLSQLFGSSEPTLLVTDFEYPGIVSAVDEEWAGRVVMARVCDRLWHGEIARITDKIIDCLRMARPSVVYMSHVARSSGYRIEEEKIIEFIRRTMPRTIVVLDGAQACGNIYIAKEILDQVDVYVTSGHKWLCGKQTLGLVYASEEWRLKDPAQSYSMASVPTGTGSKDVIESLQASLTDFNGELTRESSEQRMREVQQHNGMLARYFTEQVYKHKLGRHVAHSAEKRRRTPKTWSWNGIATVIFDTPDIPLLLQKENRQLQFTQLGTEKWRDDLGGIPPGQRYSLDPDCLDVNNMRVPKHPFEVANFTELHVPKIEGYPARFCFHYYHSTSDVDRLITRLKEASRHIKSIGRPKVMKRPT